MFIILGVVLLLVEIYVTPGVAVVGFGGIFCLIIGGLFLVPSYPTREWLISGEYMTTAFLILLAMILIFAVFFGFVLFKVIQIRRKRPSIGVFAGETAVTIDRLTPETQGYVRYKGEYWLASSKVDIEPNTKVLILRKEDTVLHVQPYKSPKN
jgi:membrane-bound serine protease (ClpP class)